MLDRPDWGNNWSALELAAFTGTLVTVVVAVLVFILEFDVRTSPAWQVWVHHLMLVLYLSLTFILASWRPFCFGKRFCRGMLVLAVLMPVTVFAGGWVTGGAYLGFRDERFFDLAVVSASSFALIWGTIVFPYSAFVFSKDLARYWRHGELPDWEPG